MANDISAKDLIPAALLQQAPTALIVTTSENNIYLINDQAIALLESEVDNLTGQPIANLFSLEPQTAWHHVQQQFSQQNEPGPLQLNLMLKAQPDFTRPVQVTMKQVQTEAGQFILYALQVISLHQEVKAALDQEKQKREKAEEDLRDFTYTISHDLKAPLRILNTYSRFFIEDFGDVLNEEGIEYLEAIAESAKLLNDQINALLNYVHIETAEEPTLVDLNNLLAGLITEMDVDNTMTITLPATLPAVYGHEKQLRQMFFHLIDNAFKFISPDRDPEIVISYTTPNNQFVQFSIADNGLGIKQAYWAKIFAVFYRLHTQEEYPGTGIGLAIIKKTVENYGGKVWLESQPGQGSTFILTLPAPPAPS